VLLIYNSGAGIMLEDIEVHPRFKLAALWSSVMFLYIYADYFGLFSPGLLATMNRGIIAPFGAATGGVMVGVGLMMALPSLMIFLSVALPARVSRGANLVMGAAYTAIIALTMWNGALFIFYGIIEMALTLLVVWYAWTWPRARS
jgi:hypothetical protein